MTSEEQRAYMREYIWRPDVRERKRQREREYAQRNPERAAYRGAKERCTNRNSDDFLDYGGRGIRFLFRSFAQFWKAVGPRPSPSHSLDRINVNGHYKPGNVRWATASEQSKNVRNPRQALWDRFHAAQYRLLGCLR